MTKITEGLPKRHTIVTLALSLLVTGPWAGPAAAQQGAKPVSDASLSTQSRHGVVAADHVEASRVGARVLEQGGSAADAGVAALLALGVVNPFGSGLGGGGFCLYRPQGGEVDVLDFRERAPGKAHRDMYVVDGEAKVELTIRGGLAVGVPGEARGLEALHERYGKLPWKDVVRPARKLAAEGFEVGGLLPKRLARLGEKLEAAGPIADEFKINGKWVEAGQKLERPELGRALLMLEQQGARPFYEGDIASAIVETVQDAEGIVELEDLKGYTVTWRKPIRGTYRGYEIFAMPPPSSGGTTILAALNILERYDLRTLGRSVESTHRITEALKHAFADRARWLGDPDFVEVPVERLISKAYAEKRMIRPDGVLPLEAYGTTAPPPDDQGTSHVSVIDGDGNMLACTSTINTSFGSLVFVEKYGLVLNNEMGDFTPQPGVPNFYGLVGNEQNTVEPGKRPLSSMSPTLVLADGEPFLAIGASGGPTIITGTLLAMLRIIDFGTTPTEAITLPRLHHQWLPNKVFIEEIDDARRQILEKRGHEFDVRKAYNSVQLVLRRADGTLVGVSDPRKMGQPAAAKK